MNVGREEARVGRIISLIYIYIRERGGDQKFTNNVRQRVYRKLVSTYI